MTPDELAVSCVDGATRLARRIAVRREVEWLADECESEALLWVVVGARKFDPESPYEPKLWVLRYVRGKVGDYLKSERQSRLRVLNLERDLIEAAARRAMPHTNAGYEDATDHLPPREKAVMDRIFLDGYGTVTAAPTLGLSRSTSCLTYRRALNLVAERVGAAPWEDQG